MKYRLIAFATTNYANWSDQIGIFRGSFLFLGYFSGKSDGRTQPIK